MQGAAKRSHGLGDDPVVGPFAALVAGDQPGFDELFHVVGDGRLGQADGCGEVADAGLASGGGGDHRQQPDPVPVAKGAEGPGEPALPTPAPTIHACARYHGDAAAVGPLAVG